MVTPSLTLRAPLEEPQASMDLTTLLDSASVTSPKTTWRPSSQEVTTVVMKNWEPLLERSVSAHASSGVKKTGLFRHTCWGRRWPWRGGKASCG